MATEKLLRGVRWNIEWSRTKRDTGIKQLRLHTNIVIIPPAGCFPSVFMENRRPAYCLSGFHRLLLRHILLQSFRFVLTSLNLKPSVLVQCGPKAANGRCH
ncbi:hypothetical protein EVAR_24923_1 [Eumeta japonica]|uniref:Uncharacterized protein n=1 Tax=Eumeta variegata TaxID=151549 RepID=A0A4C1V5W5_EUMVA|nr:hypothetical protein EVAR_24923_1 [Eumeta japonica]